MIKGQPAQKQCDQIVHDLCKAIDRICDAWPAAFEADQAAGWPTRGGEPRIMLGKDGNPIKPGPDDVRPPEADPTGDLAVRGRALLAERWLHEAVVVFRFLIWFTPADAPGERRWSGVEEPPQLRRTAKQASQDLVDAWPRNVEKLFRRVYKLADTADKEWPPTPERGAVVNGVKVLERSESDVESVRCAGCGQPVGGGAVDPVVRLDDKPYHRNPCYYTAYRRRSRGKAS